MAYALRAYWEQKNTLGITERIEIHEDGFSGSVIRLLADGRAFEFRHDEITSESSDGLVNPRNNRIQVGRLDFYPRISTVAERTLLSDILGSEDTQFMVVWKRDGNVYWKGNPNNKVSSYPETGGSYFGRIRANDFEILKGIDYVRNDNRQKLIVTIADLLGNMNYAINIKTATSWTTEQTTDATDFLDQVYHETKALRKFAKTGDEEDEDIKVWDALMKMGDPALLFRQIGGVFTVEQLSEFEDPANVHQTEYDPTGSVISATTTVDRRQTGYKKGEDGSPVVKVLSDNGAYPPLKEVRVKYEHRTKFNAILFPNTVSISGAGSEAFSQLIISDGGQKIEFGFLASVRNSTDEPIMKARFQMQADTYYLQEDGTWDTTAYTWEVILTEGREPDGTTFTWRGNFDIVTELLPGDADGTVIIMLLNAVDDVGNAPDETDYGNFFFNIKNAVANENSTSIDYKLVQAGGYPENLEMAETWFGDGPTGYSPGALRYGTGGGDLLADQWQRRGTTSNYRNFHENLLKEVMDLQRSRTRKLIADIDGDFDPTKILVYDGDSFYYTGGRYVAVPGRWSVSLMRINVQTGTDTFDDIPKFTGEGSDQGSGSSSSAGSVSQDTYDNRYLRQSQNGADIPDPAAFRANLGVQIGADVQAYNARLQEISGLTPANGAVIIGNGASFITESGATLRTSLGLGINSDVQFRDITARDLELTGVINFVNEENLEVQDKTITINKNGTDGSSVGGGVILERPSGNKSILWDGTGWALNGARIFDDGQIQNVGMNASPTWADATIQGRSVRGNIGHYGFEAASTAGQSDWNNYTTLGAWHPLSRSSESANSPSSLYYIPLTYGYVSSPALTQLAIPYGADVSEGLYLRGFHNGSSTWSDWRQIFVSGADVSYGAGNFSGAISSAGVTSTADITVSNPSTGSKVVIDAHTGFDGLLLFNQNGVNKFAINFDESRGNDLRIYDYVNAADVLYWDVATQTAGIGTNLPNGSYKLHLAGALLTDGGANIQGLATLYDDLVPDTTFTGNIGRFDRYWLTARIAELYVPKLVVEEHISTTGGVHYTGIGTILTSDINDTDTSIQVENNNLSNGDFIRLYARGQYEVMQVTSAPSGSGPYTYSVGRNIDGSGANNWTAGDGIFNTGGAAGFGFIENYAINSLTTGVADAGPATVYQVRTGTGASDIEARAATGNLNGWYGYASDVFGAAYGVPSAENITIDPTNGFRIRYGTDVAAQLSGALFMVGDAANYINFNVTTGSFDAKMQSFNLIAGADYWRTSDNTFSFGGGILNGNTSSINLAGFSVNSELLQTTFGTQGLVQIGSTNANFGGGFSNTTPSGYPTIAIYHSYDSTTTTRAMVAIGETLNSGWTGRVGMSFVPEKDAAAWFEVSRDASDGSLFAKIAGALFDVESMYSANNNKTFKGTGLYINWNDEDFSLGDRFFYDKSLDLVGLAGFSADDVHFWSGSGAGTFVGLKSGTGNIKSIFAGGDDKDGLDAPFAVYPNGAIVYPGVNRLLVAASAVAGGSDNDQVGGSSIEDWKATVTSAGGGGTDAGGEQIKVYQREIHNAGWYKLKISGQALAANPSGGGGTTFGYLRVEYGSQDSGQQQVCASAQTTGPWEDFNFEMDIYAETGGSKVLLIVRLEAKVQGSFGATERRVVIDGEDFVIEASSEWDSAVAAPPAPAF